MTKIIWKEVKKANTSKSRRRKRRAEEREQAAEDAKLERKLPALLNGCSIKTLKALSLPGETREQAQEDERDGDAMFRKVNHAHQRNPNKKWS